MKVDSETEEQKEMMMEQENYKKKVDKKVEIVEYSTEKGAIIEK